MDVFTAVADPTRRQVLDMLLLREHSAGELGNAFPTLSQPAMSRHLRVLRDVGLIQVRSDAQRRLYSLRPEAFEELATWISRYEGFWNQRLDALAAHLDARATATSPSKENPT